MGTPKVRQALRELADHLLLRRHRSGGDSGNTGSECQEILDAVAHFAGEQFVPSAGRLQLNIIRSYLVMIGVAGECSTRVFAIAEVAYLLLTTGVLALV
ncbi:hypothetical protein [Rhizobium leguminosarum]|uniref:hypothetical protein n=1 Tax=Rhizobium leguminosarum TaxID=384 RepID=UPI0028B1DEFF|nr:hypothetical protein [Rhizobium leguminosarum]